MIIVFGSLNIDIIMPVDEFPVEGETVLSTADHVSRPGGKGSNQAVAAARAGAKVAMVGKVGDDSFGRRSVTNLKKHGIWAAGVAMSDRPTGCSAITVNSRGRNLVMTSPGANMEAMADQLPDEILGSSNIVLTELELDIAETITVLERAKQNGAVTILNASPARNVSIEILKSVDYMIVNELESLQIAKAFNIEKTEPHELVAELSGLADLTCMITLEDKGAIAAKDRVLYKIPPLSIPEEDVVDSTGAGDCFCGVFAACIGKGFDWLKATHYASAGAGLSCMELGAQKAMPDFEEIEARLSETPEPEKI